MIRLVLALSVPVLVAAGGLQPSGSSAVQNSLTAQEQTAGWTLLFDGRTTNGWRGFGKKAFPAAGWVVEDGTLKSLGQKGGDIVTTSTYGDFEFAWEWRLSPQGNSGVKYFVDETRGDSGGAIGHEYQTIDDDNYTAMALSVRQKTGAWYDVLPPTKAAARPVGEWNRSRLVVNGQIVEHWLNDTLVLRYDITSAEAAAGVATSKFKNVAGYADKIRTPILLQDHNTVVWFRNLKIRELPAQAQDQPSSRAAVTVEGAWRLTETALRSASGMWEARPAPQGGLFVFTGRHYSYFYIPGSEPRARFADPNQPTDTERAATYASFIAGAGSYTFDGSTLAMKADFRKNPNEMNGDTWRLQAQLQGDRLQLVYVNPPFLPGREYRIVLVRVE